MAQEWADSCPSGHNPDRGLVGENMVFDTSSPSLAVDLWAAEAVNYDYNNHTCLDDNISNCYHYIQLVSRNTTEIGCGVSTVCNIVVCNYSPVAGASSQPY